MFRKIIPMFALMVFMLRLGEALSSLQTNEVTNTSQQKFDKIPTCTPDTVCGFLQVNTNGVTRQRFCSCSSGFQCPMGWDSEDGQSVTQGSDQYKFCGQAPTLFKCQANQMAYKSKILYQTKIDRVLERCERMYCHCPYHHYYVAAKQNFEERGNHTEAVTFTYTCAKLPICRFWDSCKTLSDDGPELLVNEKCRCPQSQRCPTSGSHLMKSWELGNNRGTGIRCQH